MPLVREHAFAGGACVWCPATETAINTLKANGKTPPTCAERWADPPNDPEKPRSLAADDFATIGARLKDIRAAGDKALAGETLSS